MGGESPKRSKRDVRKNKRRTQFPRIERDIRAEASILSHELDKRKEYRTNIRPTRKKEVNPFALSSGGGHIIPRPRMKNDHELPPPLESPNADQNESNEEDGENSYLLSLGSFNSPFLGLRRSQTVNPLMSVSRGGHCRVTSDITRNKVGKEYLTMVSKTLARILRHTFHEEGLIPYPGCFFKVDEILMCRSIRKLDLSLLNLIKIVNSDGKGRFAVAYCNDDITKFSTGRLYVDVRDKSVCLCSAHNHHVDCDVVAASCRSGRTHEAVVSNGKGCGCQASLTNSTNHTGKQIRSSRSFKNSVFECCGHCYSLSGGTHKRALMWIRANQGHSKTLFGGSLIQQLNNNEQLLRASDCADELHRGRFVFHGTSWYSLSKIIASGYLQSMARVHIHFSKTLHRDSVLTWTEPNELFSITDTHLEPSERLSGLRRNADVAIVVDVHSYLERWPVHRIHDTELYECRLDERGPRELAAEHTEGASHTRPVICSGERLPQLPSLSSVATDRTFNDETSRRNEVDHLFKSASSEDCSSTIRFHERMESYSLSTNLIEDTYGHLRWEKSKNGVILCSGCHRWPSGEAPPLFADDRQPVIDDEFSEKHSDAPACLEGVPCELFFGIIDLSTGEVMSVDEADRQSEEKLSEITD
eukprot:GHVH01011088.1.p1 GENE.GHVH01011088.1~~GHVH01011088.1.p1  ORF type:complete len:644 (+),score=66.12 GHVH01011088.1:210-2141(+)